MARYRVSDGRELSHSERVTVLVPTFPKPTTAVGYEGRMLEEGDEVELNEQDGKRLVEAGILEEAAKSRGARKK
jgi:hypothetical protein